MPKTELEWLLSGFHQDWSLQFESWQGLVDHWIEASTPARIAEAQSELSALLSRTADDEEIGRAVWRLGCEYNADEEDGGFRGWLGAINDRLVTAREESGSVDCP